jgi:hypothetical protein
MSLTLDFMSSVVLNFEFDDPRCTIAYTAITPKGTEERTIDIGNIGYIRPTTQDEAGSNSDDPNAVIVEINIDPRQEPDVIYTATPISEILNQIPPFLDIGGRYIPAALIREIESNSTYHVLQNGALKPCASVIQVLNEGPSYAFYSPVEPEELIRRLRDLVLHFAEHHYDPETDNPNLEEMKLLLGLK